MRKILFLFIALSFTLLLQAQDSTLSNTTFNHLALSVTALDRSADFYKNVLNLREITNRTKMEGIAAAEPVNGISTAIVSKRSA